MKKKILSVLLTVAMTASVLAGCGGAAPAAEAPAAEAPAAEEEAAPAAEAEEAAAPVEKAGPFKIGVATIFEGESWEVQKNYYENELAAAFNMDFMFSEKMQDANALMDFMDQAYAAGCQGIINFVTSADAVKQGAQKAEELGMYFVTQSSALVEDVAELPHNLGHVGASATGMGSAYGKAFDSLLADGEDHSLFIFSGAAVGGAIGQGAASHYYSVNGMLEAMQKAYGLTYEKSIDEIINDQNPGEVATGNDNVKIYIYPGYDPAAASTAAQTQFQSGDYDMFAAVFSYANFTNVIGDVEKSLGKNIKIAGTASIEQQTATGFETTDSTGDTLLNVAIVNPLNPANGICALLLYNGLTGHADAMKDNGKAVLFKVEPWACLDGETYGKIAGLDTAHENFVLNEQDLWEMVVENNSAATFKDIEAKLAEIADVNTVIAAKTN